MRGAAAAWLLGALLGAQQPTATEEPLAAKDPYTEGEAAAMQAAGIVRYAPMPWAGKLGTADVDKVLGPGRVLWLETAHFRIGSTLKTVTAPVDADAKKALAQEVRDLRAKLPKVKEKPARLDPWLRAHLYAQRAEALYAEFERLLAVRDEDFGAGTAVRQGRYLGLPDKFLILLFDKKADLARYLDRFCGVQASSSYRHYDVANSQMVAAFAREEFEDADEAALQSHFTYSLMLNFANGYMGYCYDVPSWLAEGLAHLYARRIPTRFVNVRIADDEAVDRQRQHLWPQRVAGRVAAGRFPRAEALLQVHGDPGLDFAGHLMSWSRVEFLRATDEAALGMLLRELKNLPLDGSGRLPFETVHARQVELLQKLFGFDLAGFDQRWQQHVLKTYPRK